MKLSEKLASTLAIMKEAKIKSLHDKANAEIAKIEKSKAERKKFLESIQEKFITQINEGKVPYHTVCGIANCAWIDNALQDEAEFQDMWYDFIAYFRKEELNVIVKYAHDGVGMKSWFEMTLEPKDGS
jgi:hypothetical protein